MDGRVSGAMISLQLMGMNSKELGARITALRLRMGESVASFAARSGVAKSHIYKLEAGGLDNPTVTTLTGIAGALGITLDELLGNSRKGEPKSEPAEPPMPPSLTQFLRDWETEHKSRMPKDVVHSLATLQFRGKRPRTVEDWRVIYAVVDRTLRD
jgi:transcriptional regulator with XRE-family HTH domain